uniref:Uncharacterized protein n=1 Tax=Arundo donax TaxID=35708 RepID=A0A0A9D1T9_ARUDO
MKRRFSHRSGKGASHDNTSGHLVENDNEVENNESGPSEERKKRGRTTLRRPPNGQQIRIIPLGEEQFEFETYSPDTNMGIGGQITELLKHEYPSVIEESPIKKYHASKWVHYYNTKDEEGMTAADRVKEEFWSIYSVDEELRPHADYAFEKFASKQCENMMYQLHLDTVKKYYDKVLNRKIKDTAACKIELKKANI